VAPYLNVSPGRIDRPATTQNASKMLYMVEEKFSNFRTENGITLPTAWDIRYSVEPVRPVILHWRVDLTKITPNPNFDVTAVFPEQ